VFRAASNVDVSYTKTSHCLMKFIIDSCEKYSEFHAVGTRRRTNVSIYELIMLNTSLEPEVIPLRFVQLTDNINIFS
jgi:hypothetical protein